MEICGVDEHIVEDRVSALVSMIFVCIFNRVELADG